jgi:Spy/CpxP family protein refolding chaperone
MKANRTLLITALAAGSLLAGSPALRAGDTNNPPSTPPAGAPPAGQPHTGFERMAAQLKLTADQKPKVQAIENSRRQKMIEINRDTTLSPKDKAAKRKAVVEDTIQQMKAVLTPEQFETWEKTSPMGPRRLHITTTPPANTNTPSSNAPSTNAPPALPKQ